MVCVVSGNSLFFSFCDELPGYVLFCFVGFCFLLFAYVTQSLTLLAYSITSARNLHPPSPLTHVQGDSRSAVGFLHCGSFSSAVLWASSTVAMGQVMGCQSVGYPVESS